MIRWTTDRSPAAVTRAVQIFCDRCQAPSPSKTVVQGTALTEDATSEDGHALAALRAESGFTERLGPITPKAIGDTQCFDICPRCAAQQTGATA